MITRDRIEEIESELYFLKKREKENIKQSKKHIKNILYKCVKVQDTDKYKNSIFYFKDDKLLFEVNYRNNVSAFIGTELYDYLVEQKELGHALTKQILLNQINKHFKKLKLASLCRHGEYFQPEIEEHFKIKDNAFLQDVINKN